jgi:hypothetical protein
MPGGLLEISSFSAESLFLNGAPEITYFKTVYRRHTNFAIESLNIGFEDPVEFNGFNTAKISQTGDLMHNVYLEVVLPQINLFRNTMPDDSTVQTLTNIYNTAKNNYTTVLEFMDINTLAYVNAYNIYIAQNNNQNATSDMKQAIMNIFNGFDQEPMESLLSSDPSAPFTYDEICMESIADTFDTTANKNDLFKALSIGIDKSIKTQSYYYYAMYDANVTLQDSQNKNIKFAWIKRIGHFIAEYIEVKIGGHTIDKHYGTWINIWYELTANRSIEETYFKMIGNVSELTDFNRTIKPQYLLKIPLTFWFCKFSGLAIPLVALEYHNVSFHVKFRALQELSYIEKGTNIYYSLDPDGIVLQEVPDIITNINISATMLIDFYFLDSHERRRFAQSSHEYLIDQIQYIEMPNTTLPGIQIQMNSFVHPTKEIVFAAQKTSYTMNIDGTNECRWDNFSISDENKGNAINSASLDFNSYKRVMELDGNYFNYVVPYERYPNGSTPSDGINIYSFGINGMEFQPSGTANFSKIARIILTLSFNSKLFTNGVITDPLVVYVFTRNINILRIISGFAVITYTYLQ